MTVQQLIENLLKCNMHELVIITGPDGVAWSNLKTVTNDGVRVKLIQEGETRFSK